MVSFAYLDLSLISRRLVCDFFDNFAAKLIDYKLSPPVASQGVLHISKEDVLTTFHAAFAELPTAVPNPAAPSISEDLLEGAAPREATLSEFLLEPR